MGKMPDKVEMERARPMTCSVKGCGYVTDPTCETRVEVREDLTYHQEEGHEAAALLDARIKKETADSRIRELKAEAEFKAQEAELVKKKANLVSREKGTAPANADDSSGASRGKDGRPMGGPIQSAAGG